MGCLGGSVVLACLLCGGTIEEISITQSEGTGPSDDVHNGFGKETNI